MSIAEYGLRPQDSFTSFLPKMDITQPLAIWLRQRDGLSIREAAETLGVPEGTLKEQLARGRAKLVQRFQKAACRPRTKAAIRDAALKRKEYCRPESVRALYLFRLLFQQQGGYKLSMPTTSTLARRGPNGAA